MNSAKQTATAPPETAAAAAENIRALVPLFREIGNLKRIRAAETAEISFAAELFRRAWNRINAGADARETAFEIAAAATVGANLGAITATVLRAAELNESEIETILRRSFDAAAAPVEEDLRGELRERIAAAIDFDEEKNAAHFVRLLIEQPRSGATKVGAPKVVFDAPENHAEHCAAVAVFGVLLAPVYGADTETVFLAALAHHFHNAYLPDSGFAGEEHLGEFLPRVFESFRRRCLAEIPENLHEKIRRALKIIETADAPEARAFHAADVIDRVLQMRHHAELNEFTLKYAMEEAELVHAGAVQSFHYDVLRAARLIG